MLQLLAKLSEIHRTFPGQIAQKELIVHFSVQVLFKAITRANMHNFKFNAKLRFQKKTMLFKEGQYCFRVSMCDKKATRIKDASRILIHPGNFDLGSAKHLRNALPLSLSDYFPPSPPLLLLVMNIKLLLQDHRRSTPASI